MAEDSRAEDVYEVVFRVEPTHPFGLPTAGYMVVPHGEEWEMHFDFNVGTGWATRKDGSDAHRRDDQALNADVMVGPIRVVASDNLFTVRLAAVGREEAVEEARHVLGNLLRAVCTYWPGPGFDFLPRALRVFNNGRVSNRQPEMTGGLYPYDTRHFAELLADAASLIGSASDDRRLSRALEYFSLGDDLLRLKRDADEEDSRLLAITPLRFLQYWKAIAMIVGDPSRDRDYQARPRGLGLGRTFFRQRVNPMNELRNNFDVAHVTDPDAPRIVSPEQVEECRRIAVEVIHAYARSLKPD